MRGGHGPLFLPGALPGERVRIGIPRRRGQGWWAPSDLITPAPDRATPACPHFGACGGCVAQHLRDAAYLAWKQRLVADALARLGWEGELAPPARTLPGERRRMDLALRRTPEGVRIGLHARHSADIVDMRDCPVLAPPLLALVQALRPALAGLSALRREGSAVVNLLDTGPDLLLRTDAPLTAADRALLARLAAALALARIAWAPGPRDMPEPACVLRPSRITLDGYPTEVAPGAFLQASAPGEAAIRTAVLAALPERLKPRARIIELFAGAGTLSHGLSRRARVEAFEADPLAVAALRQAGNPRVTARLRDLARQPLQPPELAGAALVVLDPPWAGAAAQMPALAAAGLPVIYVACNPASLARDGQVLRAAGYRVGSAAVIDQFLWSARIEAVVGFLPPRAASRPLR